MQNVSSNAQWWHHGSPSSHKFKVQASVGKPMATFFFETRREFSYLIISNKETHDHWTLLHTANSKIKGRNPGKGDRNVNHKSPPAPE